MTIFNIKSVGMFIVYFHTKPHMPNSNGSFAIDVKIGAEFLFHGAGSLSSYDFACVTVISQVGSSVKLALLIVEN
jgi:hypothetical protein